MHYKKLTLLGFIAALLTACMSAPQMQETQQQTTDALKQQVMDTERSFAKTMADRDHTAFTAFLSDEAIFFSSCKPLRGKQKIAEAWKPLYKNPKAPFSWAPELVDVLDSGTLALSSGPVYDPGGKLIGKFTSIWRLQAPGTWRIVFDKGNEDCN